MKFYRKIRKRIFKQRGIGCIRNPIDSRDRLFEPSGQQVGVGASLEQYVTVVDQKSTSSCVGNAVAGAVYIMEQKSGHQYGYPSRMFLYWNARRRHENPPLKDDGTYIRECCKALAKIGVPDEGAWPFKTRRVNDKPRGFRPWMEADPRKNGEYLSIASTGSFRIDRITSAIAEGYPVVFGTDLVQSFMSASGPDVISRPKTGEKIVGGHAMVIVGYRTVDGKVQLRVLNSWGKYWRDGGLCWFTEDYITWSRSRDFTIIRGWKRA
jgi:hypothetical protein